MIIIIHIIIITIIIIIIIIKYVCPVLMGVILV